MKTFEKTIQKPLLEIEEYYIQDTIKDFLDYNGLEVEIQIDNDESIYYNRGEKLKGRGLVEIAVGYYGDIYFVEDGLPIFSQGYNEGKIRVKQEEKDLLKALVKLYNDGKEYYFILHNEKGEVEDTCGGMYTLEEVKDQLPEEWKKENMEDYLTLTQK